MILKDVLIYLRNNTALATVMDNRIYSIQAPSSVKMPYLIIEPTSGMRESIVFNVTGGKAWFRITVDVGPTDEVNGYTMIWTALRALENYRGDMGDTKDVVVTCGEPRGWAGIGGAYRYQFEAYFEYTEDRQTPH